MPLQSNLQLVKLQYREFLRKTAAYHRGEGGDAVYYVESAQVEGTLDQSLQKLTSAIASIKLADLRASYNARKERAKERLRRAFDAKVSRLNSYLNSSSASTDPTSSMNQELLASDGPAVASTSASVVSHAGHLQHLFGTNGILRRTVLYLVGHAARALMTSLNTTRVEGLIHMAAALDRPAGQALITVSNHVAAMDDPLVVAVIIPPEKLEQPEGVRWTLCASDRCFRYSALVPFFRAAKVLPVVRGGGLAQPGMAAAEARLAAGDWVHIFPEGTRSPDGVSLGAVRKGVGALVAGVPAGAPPPLVVPFVHRGMEDVMPRGAVLPAVGQKVDVLVGEPIPVADLLAAARADQWPADRLHTAVAARVASGLQDLRTRLEAMRAGLPDPGSGSAGSVGDGNGVNGHNANSDTVSSLDQFDPSDLTLAAELRAARRRRRREGGGGGEGSGSEGGGGGVSSAWERLKFQMALQQRSWATQGQAGQAQGGETGVPAGVAGPAAAAGGGGGLEGVSGSGAVGAGLGRGGSPAVGSWAAGVSPYLRQLSGLMERTGSGQAVTSAAVAGGGVPGWWRQPVGAAGSGLSWPGMGWH